MVQDVNHLDLGGGRQEVDGQVWALRFPALRLPAWTVPREWGPQGHGSAPTSESQVNVSPHFDARTASWDAVMEASTVRRSPVPEVAERTGSVV